MMIDAQYKRNSRVIFPDTLLPRLISGELPETAAEDATL